MVVADTGWPEYTYCRALERHTHELVSNGKHVTKQVRQFSGTATSRNAGNTTCLQRAFFHCGAERAAADISERPQVAGQFSCMAQPKPLAVISGVARKRAIGRQCAKVFLEVQLSLPRCSLQALLCRQLACPQMAFCLCLPHNHLNGIE